MVQKYRGVRIAHVVSVVEGDGKDTPFEEIEYVLIPTEQGYLKTAGRMIPLTQEEKDGIGSNSLST